MRQTNLTQKKVFCCILYKIEICFSLYFQFLLWTNTKQKKVFMFCIALAHHTPTKKLKHIFPFCTVNRINVFP